MPPPYRGLRFRARKEYDMNSRLGRMTDLAGRAATVHYRVDEIASACGMSTRQLERVIREELKLTPRRWLENVRLDAACCLLSKGYTVKEAARAADYSSPEHFSRAFKRHFGQPPSRKIPPRQ
jgi:AraC-like DNA-binding protein